jgi:hypothetical protein
MRRERKGVDVGAEDVGAEEGFGFDGHRRLRWKAASLNHSAAEAYKNLVGANVTARGGFLHKTDPAGRVSDAADAHHYEPWCIGNP